MQIHEILMITATAIGALTDIRSGKIPNALTYPLWVFGMVYGLTASGRDGLIESLSGFVLAFVPCFLLYMIGGLGGGDVKMLAAVGALMGFHFTASALLTSVFAGALIAVLLVIWQGRIRSTLRLLGAQLLGRQSRTDLEPEAQVPFGVAIFLACVLTLVESWHGGHPWLFSFSGWMG